MKAKQNELPTLGVVVPVYNEVDSLPECLERLLGQSADIAEIIVVDNNSTDGSEKIAKVYAQKSKKIKLRGEITQGLVPTRNAGFKVVSADIVGRIDADTFVLPGWASSVRQYFAGHPEISALVGMTYYYDLPLYRLTSKITDVVTGGFSRKAHDSPKLYGPNMALRVPVAKKEIKKRCGPGRINEDLDITIHLRSAGQKIAFCPDMRAEVSGRRFLSSPIASLRYCLQWPRTYHVHGMYGAAAATYLASFFICLAQTLLVLPLRAYNPKDKRLSLQYLMHHKNSRVVP